MYLLSPAFDKLMYQIAREADAYVKLRHVRPKTRILFPTSYIHVQFNRVIDFILPISLKIRGAEIIPILCNQFHDEQCPVWSGVFVKDFKQQCTQLCNQPAHRLWHEILGYSPKLLTRYRIPGSREVDQLITCDMNSSNFSGYRFNGFSIGNQAAEVVANSNNLGRVLSDTKYDDELKLHATNAIEMILAYEIAIKELQPDVCVGSMHDHYQWSTLYHVASTHGISYYSYTMLDQKGCAYFGKDVQKVCEVDGAWPSFREVAVEPELWDKFDAYMENKADGRTTYFSLYPSRGNQEFEKLKDSLDPQKPLAFFPVNVPWDNAIHNFCYLARDIIEMIQKTVRYFNRHPEFQFIIKSHPMEQNFVRYGFLPHTVRKILEDMNEPLGPNIIFIDSDSSISSFDIYPIIDLGIVHSSRSGVEMALCGKPVILTADNHYRGKGFTIDISTEEEFYASIENILNYGESQQNVEDRTRLTRKYWLLYNFHGFVDLGLFEDGWVKPAQLEFTSLEDFLPGKNEKLDYICDSILNGEPIFGESRWPPVSL
jgi:hypothetical protein